MTAYREDALACADLLARRGAMKGAAVRDATGVPKASIILRNDVYGWFEKVGRGIYALSPGGRTALIQYHDVLAARTSDNERGVSDRCNGVAPQPHSDCRVRREER